MDISKLIEPTNDNWQYLKQFFPENWRELAVETKASFRLRQDKSVEDMLRVLLMHIGCGYSLRETAARAKLAGLAQMSDVAILHRLKKSSRWLQALAQSMLDEKIQPESMPLGKRVVAYDASVIREPGKTGSQWRLHFGIQLPELACNYFEVTPAAGSGNGESFTRFPIQENEYVIADRGYCTKSGIFYLVNEAKAHVLVRSNSQKTYLDQKGADFDSLAHLRTLCKAGAVGAWPVFLRNESGEEVHGRLCAIRKTKDSIMESQRSIRRTAARKQKKVSKRQLEHAKYVVVFTTFPEDEFTAEDVMKWYRVRWQIELVFKRFKSIADLGHLPKHDPVSAQAWLYGKLFLALVTERAIQAASEFSPR